VKKFILIFLAILISIPALRAAEEIAVKPISMAESQGANPFSMTVTGSGKMIPKPGAVSVGKAHYEDTILPYLVSTPKPIEYPRWAMRQGWQGNLEIALEILLDGTVGRYHVMKSSGYRLLDEAAVEAVKTWRFAPATKDGKPVLTCIELPVRFQLEN
jgi:TonB family protein